MRERGRGAMAPRGHGFTLVELLVVVGVISVLVMLLLPAVTNSREAGRGSLCASRMRQLGLAVTLYASEHADEFPRSQHSAFTHREQVWSRSLAPYLQSNSNRWSELLKTVYRCPSDTRTGSTPSYGVNVYFEVGPDDDYEGKPQTWRHRADVRRPAGTLHFAENASEADHMMPNFWASTAEAQDVASRRHRGLASYTFVDGHVETRSLESLYNPPVLDRWHPDRVP